MVALVATRLTYVTLDADRTISTDSIRVHNIFVENRQIGTDVNVVFTDNDGNILLRLAVLEYESDQFNGIWIADNGLHISSVGNVLTTVTVFHTYGGA